MVQKSGVHQLRLVVYPIMYRVLYIPAGCLGFLPSTVSKVKEWEPISHPIRFISLISSTKFPPPVAWFTVSSEASTKPAWATESRQIDSLIPIKKKTNTWQFFVTFLGWLSDPFQWLNDLQLGDEKVTLNHLAPISLHRLQQLIKTLCSQFISKKKSSYHLNNLSK